ncbi:uncharacterized protein K489DRAFT_374812 [Dissoconium aciculare CBS 342.82]|uniref:Uncharacterized protein n=1 Tax=Dissoconium aciculare CBS 342.82 TaxID=1314786 RepID=A0A6J3LQ88_9PEZI|nr:uncharacterized protein K489DRAFT_374812 [Dissoconium aciculare CBS 342.82]KAF1817808.1 hypothetical protein K489DRAFT_374812 [Dissoconium aciculare CBS 342.82]
MTKYRVKEDHEDILLQCLDICIKRCAVGHDSHNLDVRLRRLLRAVLDQSLDNAAHEKYSLGDDDKGCTDICTPYSKITGTGIAMPPINSTARKTTRTSCALPTVVIESIESRDASLKQHSDMCSFEQYREPNSHPLVHLQREPVTYQHLHDNLGDAENPNLVYTPTTSDSVTLSCKLPEVAPSTVLKMPLVFKNVHAKEDARLVIVSTTHDTTLAQPLNTQDVTVGARGVVILGSMSDETARKISSYHNASVVRF